MSHLDSTTKILKQGTQQTPWSQVHRRIRDIALMQALTVSQLKEVTNGPNRSHSLKWVTKIKKFSHTSSSISLRDTSEQLYFSRKTSKSWTQQTTTNCKSFFCHLTSLTENASTPLRKSWWGSKLNKLQMTCLTSLSAHNSKIFSWWLLIQKRSGQSKSNRIWSLNISVNSQHIWSSFSTMETVRNNSSSFVQSNHTWMGKRSTSQYSNKQHFHMWDTSVWIWCQQQTSKQDRGSKDALKWTSP